MASRTVAMTIAVISSGALGQVAEYEEPNLFGECHPVFAATENFLTVYKDPDLRSSSKRIPYSKGWNIPYRIGHTRVIRVGRATAKTDVPLDDCVVEPPNVRIILAGQTVEYLFYEGEGYGRVRIEGGQCTVPIHDNMGHFEVLEPSEVQLFIQAEYADGTSPGWVPLAHSEIRVAGMQC